MENLNGLAVYTSDNKNHALHLQLSKEDRDAFDALPRQPHVPQADQKTVDVFDHFEGQRQRYTVRRAACPGLPDGEGDYLPNLDCFCAAELATLTAERRARLYIKGVDDRNDLVVIVIPDELLDGSAKRCELAATACKSGYATSFLLTYGHTSVKGKVTGGDGIHILPFYGGNTITLNNCQILKDQIVTLRLAFQTAGDR